MATPDLAADLSWGAFLVDEEDVTFLVCTCDLVVRLTSPYRHSFKHLVLEKHAAVCSGAPGSLAERKVVLEAEARRYGSRSQPM